MGHLNTFGDLWMWLELMWLQFEFVRGPVGVAWGRFGAGMGPFGPQTGPESTTNERPKNFEKLK